MDKVCLFFFDKTREGEEEFGSYSGVIGSYLKVIGS